MSDYYGTKMKFKTILTKKGKEIYIGANKEVMNINLIKFKADNLRKAEQFFSYRILSHGGSSQEIYYQVVEDK